MDGLRLDDFADAVGRSWQVDSEGTPVSLRLDVAQPLPWAMRAEGGFRLEWVGPSEPLLAQATNRFSRGDAGFDMFIVPVGREADGVRYEAVFN